MTQKQLASSVGINALYSVRDAKIVLQCPVHAGDHVVHHLRRRVPDAQLLAQVGIEGFEERLIEVRHCFALVELGEEGGAVHPVERGGRPVQHLDEAERLQPSGVGKLLEQRPQHRRAQMPDRLAPMEPSNFVLVGEDALGRPEKLETFRLARDAEEFARRLDKPRAFAREVGAALGEYLSRVLSHRVALAEPKDLAWLLASYARDGLARVEAAADAPSLKAVRSALEEALGVHFDGEKGARFFHSTLVQTLFYGVFSAWVLWARAGSKSDAGPLFASGYDHASFRNLPLARSSLLHLLRRIEAEIGMARALIGKLADAEHLRLERRADGIEQVRQRPIT